MSRRIRIAGFRIGAVALCAVAVGVLPTVATAQIQHPSVVQANPANFTPNVQDDAVASNAQVYALWQIGTTMYAGGNFRTVTNSTRTQTFTRFHIMAFDATNGTMGSFNPNFDAPVWAMVSSGNSLYVGGAFTSVNGVARRALVKIDATTGAVDTAFNANLPSGRVTETRIVAGRLIVSGTFPKKLVALNLTTGADTGYINVPITGSVASNAGPTEVYKFAVDPAGTRLVGLGNFTSVGGQSRWRAFMLTLGPTAATVNAWNYPPLTRLCAASSLPDYMRDVDFSPDGSYFVFVSTGFVPQTGRIGTDLCDATARFETNVASPSQPTWINYTGGDTLHSVAVTGAAVYVQGHQRWLNNPQGRDFAGPGAVSRPGIGAISPTTGLALSLEPDQKPRRGRQGFPGHAGGFVGRQRRAALRQRVPVGNRLLSAVTERLTGAGAERRNRR